MCYQWVRRGRKVTPDNSDARSLVRLSKRVTEKVATAASFGCVEILLVILVRLHGSIHSKCRLPTARGVLALPLEQQIQCRASGFVVCRACSIARK